MRAGSILEDYDVIPSTLDVIRMIRSCDVIGQVTIRIRFMHRRLRYLHILNRNETRVCLSFERLSVTRCYCVKIPHGMMQVS